MKTALHVVVGALIGYLACAFYSVSFDISLWSEECRFLAVMLMLCGGAAGFMAELL